LTVETFLTAFLGAALAFLFFLAGEVFVRAYERSRAHYNAVVKIEALMNELLDEVSILTNQLATYRNKIDEGKILTELPRLIRFDGATVRSDLYDLDLVNRFMSLTAGMRRLNNDIENIREAYSRLADRYVDKILDEEAYKKNARHIVEGSEKLANVLRTGFTEEIKDLLAVSRVHLAKPRPIGHRIVGEVVRALFIGQVKATDEERRRERESLEKEIATVREQSKARIAGFESKTPPSSG
jgi:hypothetical protein